MKLDNIKYIVAIFCVSIFGLINSCYGVSTQGILKNLSKECGISDVHYMFDKLQKKLNMDVTAENNIEIRALISDIESLMDQDRINLEIQDCCERNNSDKNEQKNCIGSLKKGEALPNYCSDSNNSRCASVFNNLMSMVDSMFNNRNSIKIKRVDNSDDTELPQFIMEYMNYCKFNVPPGIFSSNAKDELKHLSFKDQRNIEKEFEKFFNDGSATVLKSASEIEKIAVDDCCKTGNSDNNFCDMYMIKRGGFEKVDMSKKSYGSNIPSLGIGHLLSKGGIYSKEASPHPSKDNSTTSECGGSCEGIKIGSRDKTINSGNISISVVEGYVQPKPQGNKDPFQYVEHLKPKDSSSDILNGIFQYMDNEIKERGFIKTEHTGMIGQGNTDTTKIIEIDEVKNKKLLPASFACYKCLSFSENEGQANKYIKKYFGKRYIGKRKGCMQENDINLRKSVKLCGRHFDDLFYEDDSTLESKLGNLKKDCEEERSEFIRYLDVWKKCHYVLQ